MINQSMQNVEGAQGPPTNLDMQGGAGVVELDEAAIHLPEKPKSLREMELESGARSYMKSTGKTDAEIDGIFNSARDREIARKNEAAKLRYQLRVKRAALGKELDDAEAAQGDPRTGKDFNELAGFNEFKMDPGMISDKTPDRQKTELFGRYSGDTGLGEYAREETVLGLFNVGGNLANIHLALIEAERKGESSTGAWGFVQSAYKIMKLPLESIPFVGKQIARDAEDGMIKMYGAFMNHAFGDGDRSVDEILEHRIPRFYIPTGPEALDLSDPQNGFRMIGNLIPSAVAGTAAVGVALKGVAMTKSSFAVLRASNALKNAGLLTKSDRVRRAGQAVNNLKAVRGAKEAVKALGQAPGVPATTKAVTSTAKLAGKGVKAAASAAKSPTAQKYGGGAAKLVADAAVTGGVAEVVAFRKEDYRLANMMQDMEWGDAWGTMVVAEPWDTEAELYNKQFNEGAAITLTLGLLGKAVKAWGKAGAKRLKAQRALQASEDQVDRIADGEKLVKIVDEASEEAPKPKRKRKKRAAKKAAKKTQPEPVKAEPQVEVDELADVPADTPKARKAKNRDEFIETHKEYKKATQETAEETTVDVTEGVVEEVVDDTIAGTAPAQVSQTIKRSDATVAKTSGAVKLAEETGESIIVAASKVAKEAGDDLGSVSTRFVAEDLPANLNPSKNKLVKSVLDNMRVSPKAFAMLRKYLPTGELNRLSRAAKKAFGSGEGIPFSQLTPQQQQLFTNMGFDDFVPSSALQETVASTRIMLAVEEEVLKHSHGKLARMVEAVKSLEKQVKSGVKGAEARLAKLQRETDMFWDDMMSSTYLTDKVNGVFSVAGHFLQSATGRSRQKLAAKMRNKLQGLLDDGQLSKKQMQDEYLKFAKSLKIDKIDYDNFVQEKLTKHQLDLKRAQIQQKIDMSWEKYGADESMVAKREARIAELKKLAKDNGCG